MFTESTLTTEFFNSLSADNPERFMQYSQEKLKAHSIKQPDTSHIDWLKRELTAIKTRKKTWLKSLGNQVISQEEYLEMTQEDTKNEALLSEELNSIVEENIPLDDELILALLTNLSGIWLSASDFEKKSFINDLFETITIDVPADYKRAPGKTPSILIKHFKLK